MAVLHDRDLALALAGRGGRVASGAQRPRPLGRAEQLELDMRLGHAARLQVLDHALDHGLRTAHKSVIDIAGPHPGGEQLIDFIAVQATIEQLNVLAFAAHDVDQREALHIEVLEVFDFLAKQHRGRGAVAEEQREAAARFGRQGRLHQREHRRDAAAHRERHIVARVVRVEVDGEVARRRHHFQALAGLQLVVGPVGEHPLVDLLDGHAQHAVARRRTDGVRAAHLLAVQAGAQGQVLARPEAEVAGQLGRQVERDHHGVARVARHRSDLQHMEWIVAHGAGIQWGLK
ncbi:Uncharacterised protein [Bordetella pertussis]|nr:Uncharacterised protein [Bordetella pertussis]CFL86855.1 Uncharacterised protein [Bordetella pertussis]CFM03758.1 Uncharacterised protein [Bordetella pertussis]CFM39140.1 Uncharacterised protein [Bordetella pertussis]CFM42243.1 Uncharacterised protein [Bordetella pertussis]